ERLSGQRRRFKAFDTVARDLRAVAFLPRENATWQHLRVLQRLSQDNKNFPSLLEYHQQGNDIAVVLLWIPGDNLRQRMRQGRSQPRVWPSPHESFRILRGLAHGVSQLHNRANCVHGDIKPENIILAKQPERAVLVDFGSAWNAERTVQRAVGDGQTNPYAAPEQQRDAASVDFRV